MQGLIAQAATWPGQPILRHNDAGYLFYVLSTPADFGLTAADPGLERAAAAVLAHRSADGALQSLLNVAPAFGGTGEDTWSCALCDAPALLYALLALGLGRGAGRAGGGGAPGDSRGRERLALPLMYQAWWGWSFADKKRPSPWLTFLAARIGARAEAAATRRP